ncbi:MAG: DUF2334 domain-containing protein [Candidatus Heimdallarchaeota archaeon]
MLIRSNKVLFLYNRRVLKSFLAKNLLKWFYHTIYRIPVLLIDTSKNQIPPLARNLLESKEKNKIPFSAIFLLSMIDGKSSMPEWAFQVLETYLGKVPIISFYKTILLAPMNDVLAKILPLELSSKVQSPLSKVVPKGALENIWHESGASQLHPFPLTQDNFLVINAKEPCKILAEIDGKPFAVETDSGFYFGQKDLLGSVSGGFLETNKPFYYFFLWDAFLRLTKLPFVRIRPKSWPVAIRVDDLPSIWYLREKRARRIPLEDLKNICRLLERKKAIINCATVARDVLPSGALISWNESPDYYARSVWKLLRSASEKGLVEISSHGLTHLIADQNVYRSIMNRFWWKNAKIRRFLIRKGFFANLTREFYNCRDRRRLSKEIQKANIRESKEILEDEFGVRINSFVPSAHAWSKETEQALHECNIEFISADMNYQYFPPGSQHAKRPSLIGNRGYLKDGITFVSKTVFGSWSESNKTFEISYILGIPFIFGKHSFHPDCLNENDLRSIFNEVSRKPNAQIQSLEKIGKMLRSLESSKVNAEINGSSGDQIVGELSITPGMQVEVLNSSKYVDKLGTLQPRNKKLNRFDLANYEKNASFHLIRL